MVGRVVGVFAGPVRSLRSPREPGGAVTAWRSAILKGAVPRALVGATGLGGDAQKERKHHGGPFKAVLVYAAAHYTAWERVLPPHAALHADALRAMSAEVDASAFGFGAFGENVTVDGPSEDTVCIGDTWRIGTCELQVTEPRGPCNMLTRRWMRPALLGEVQRSAASGWYNAVVRAGEVAPGDDARLLHRVQEAWTVARVFHLLEARRARRADVEALRDAPFTNPGLRERLARRANTPGRLVD